VALEHPVGRLAEIGLRSDQDYPLPIKLGAINERGEAPVTIPDPELDLDIGAL
jgi:hypothetical protein